MKRLLQRNLFLTVKRWLNCDAQVPYKCRSSIRIKLQLTEATLPVVYSDAHVATGLQIGYVPAFDQTIERSLAALGVAAKR